MPTQTGPQMRLYELNELADIYKERGLPADLAKQVATHLTKNDGEHELDTHPPPPRTHTSALRAGACARACAPLCVRSVRRRNSNNITASCLLQCSSIAQMFT